MIIEISEIAQAFRNAHLALITRHPVLSGNHFNLMTNLWLEDYGVEVLAHNGRFSHLVFESEQDLLMFRLKWA